MPRPDVSVVGGRALGIRREPVEHRALARLEQLLEQRDLDPGGRVESGVQRLRRRDDGLGDDRVEFTANSVGVTFTSDGGNDTIIGSGYADKLTGSAGHDWIEGRGGNDSLHGSGGNDTLLSGAGNDQVDDGSGNDRIDFAATDNQFWAPDPDIVPVWEEHLEKVRKSGSSTGAVVAVEATGVPAGWGAPIYGKLDADLAAALMSINAAKGVEIGAGFASAALSGEENADEMRMGNDGKPLFLSNHAGGILGGISTGQPVVARFAVKPTSSILTPRQSIDRDGNNVEVMTTSKELMLATLRLGS